MNVLRAPCRPITRVVLRHGRWHSSKPLCPTSFVARAVGAPVDRRRGGAANDDAAELDTYEDSGRKLRPLRASGDGFGGDDTPRYSGGEESRRSEVSERQPSRRRLFSESPSADANEDSNDRPSTSGRDREWDRRADYSRGGGDYRRGAGNSSRRGDDYIRRRRDDNDDANGDAGGRGGGGWREREPRRDGGEREYGSRGDRRDGGAFRSRRDDRYDKSDERRRDDRYGDRRGRPDRDESRRRSDRDGRRDTRGGGGAAAAAATEPVPAPAPAPVARPPGSSTGNKPLPYELPIVRPGDGDKGTFFAGSSWRQAGANEEVLSAVRSLGISRPSHIQALAFSTLSGPSAGPRSGSGAESGSGTDRRAPPVVLADQAGSGKTLAYLLPMMQLLRQEEVAAGGRVTKPKRPRGIVVAPTVELVQQVLRVARALSGAGLRCRTAAFTGGQKDEKARAVSFRTQKELLSEGVDLVVATPGRLQKHLEGGTLELEDCRMLVLDEVDVIMGDKADFSSQIAPLRAAAPPSMRLVLVTATMPQHTFAELRDIWPDIRTVFGPGLHRTAAGLVEELVDCSGGDEITEESGRKRKLEALKTLLERHRAVRTMVFCNKIDACRDVENFLTRMDPGQQMYRVLPYHEAIRDDLRAEAMVEFLRPVKQQQPLTTPRQKAEADQGPGVRGQSQQPEEQPELQQPPQQQQRPRADQSEGEVPLVLVATDRTSRGIDAPYCEHVVLFDFPRDPSEYVRRVGRTARGAGGRGTVSSLVLGRQVPLAKEIIERNQKGMPLHSLPE